MLRKNEATLVSFSINTIKNIYIINSSNTKEKAVRRCRNNQGSYDVQNEDCQFLVTAVHIIPLFYNLARFFSLESIKCYLQSRNITCGV